MNLAQRLGWTDRRLYVPAMFAVTAFALGVQIALVTEALGAAGYPPAGKEGLAWGSGLVLALSAVLHVPWSDVRAKLEGLGRSPIPRRSVHLRPYDPAREATVGEPAHNGDGEVDADLKVRLHSPLSAGPAVAPGEELPIVVEAEPEQLARKLEVQITVRGPEGSRTVHERMPGTELEHVITFEETGPFTVRVEVDHPRADPVAKTLQGRVTTYDEEIGRLFEQLKEQAARAGLDVTPSSTPREVCQELRGRESADASQLADLAVELEVALYGDDEVDRATYETVHAAIAATDLLDEAPAQGVHR
jgi:hypothetical protein